MAKPFIRYPGGKRSHIVIDRLADLLRNDPTNTTFVEPMLGGGAAFFALQERGALEGKLVVLGDVDVDLIDLYAAIRTNPHQVFRKAVNELDLVRVDRGAKKQKETYTIIRDVWNTTARGRRSPGTQLFLRAAVFNGLFRRNLEGELNTPPRDNLGELHLPSVAELLEVAAALEDVELVDWDFRAYDAHADMFIGPGVLVYLDPPYDGEGTFRDYVAGGFDEDDQVQLIQQAAEWSRRGATVVYSNADTPFILAMLDQYWTEAKIDRIDATRVIAADSEKRAPAPEVIAYVA